MKDRKNRVDEKMKKEKTEKALVKLNAEEIKKKEDEVVNLLFENKRKVIKGNIVENNKRKKIVFKMLKNKE